MNQHLKKLRGLKKGGWGSGVTAEELQYNYGYNAALLDAEPILKEAVEQSQRETKGNCVKRIEEELHKVRTFPREKRPDATVVLTILLEALNSKSS